VEYKVIKNNSDRFWEDNKDNSFGIDKDLIIKSDNNKISIESHGVDVILYRDNKKAKISVENKVIKGLVKENDKLYLGDEVIIKFEDFAPAKPNVNWNLWMGIIILLVILMITFLGWKKTTEINAENSYQKNFTEIKDNIKKADDIKSMDPEASLNLLNEAKNKLSQITNNKKHTTETIEIEKQINEKLVVGGSTEVVGFTEVYNTKSADVADRNYDKMVVSGNEAILSESKTGKIILVNLDLGSVTKFDVGQEIVELIYANKKIYFYDGRSILDTTKNKIADIGDIVFFKILNWNGSWYLLGQGGKISKLVGGKTSSWTSESTTLIDKPVDMVIDGTVWVVGINGDVQNYEKGVAKKWTPSIKISGEKVLGITTTADSAKVAIVTDKKIYIFEKLSGKLLATHNFEKIGIIQAKMASNDQIYVLGVDQKIYKVK